MENNIDMYDKNSTFISLSGNINDDTKKIDAAAKTLQSVYCVHSKIEEQTKQNKPKKEINEGEGGIDFHVSSDIHGDINGLNYNLNNVISLKQDSFLVIDSSNGKKIFDGSIDKIKDDLKKGENSSIIKALKEKRKNSDENLKAVANMVGKGLLKKVKESYQKDEEKLPGQLEFDDKNQKLKCKYEFSYWVEKSEQEKKEQEGKNDFEKSHKKVTENVDIEIGLNEVVKIYCQHKDTGIQNKDTGIQKIQEYIFSCFEFLKGKICKKNCSVINNLSDCKDENGFHLGIRYVPGKLSDFSSYLTEQETWRELITLLDNIKNFSGWNISDKNNIVLLNDFKIREGFDPKEEKNILTGDHIDRGPHSIEVLCMELQVKEKLKEKLGEKKLDNDNDNENKIILNKIIDINEDNDDKMLEGEDGLILVAGDHEFGFFADEAATPNEISANLLAKKMITDGQLVPSYLHETKDGKIISHSHVLFWIPHVFQVFRQIDELMKLAEIVKDIEHEDFFGRYKDNEFVQILVKYEEKTKYGKIILKSLVDTYKKVLQGGKYTNFLQKIGLAKEKDEDNKKSIEEIREIIENYKSKFYNSWDECVDSGYDFYKKVEKKFNLSTKDFFMLRDFAADIFLRPVAGTEETKKELMNELACGKMKSEYSYCYNMESKFNELLDCFAEYFSSCKNGFNINWHMNTCLTSLRIIKFKENDGYASHMYFERKLVENLDDSWSVEKNEQKKAAKLIFPNVIQFTGHDRNDGHKIEVYDKSAINNDPASSIAYGDTKTTSHPSKIIYNSENLGAAKQFSYQVYNMIKPQVVKNDSVELKLGFHSKEDLEKRLSEKNKIENKIENNKNKNENENNKKKEENKDKVNGGNSDNILFSNNSSYNELQNKAANDPNSIFYKGNENEIKNKKDEEKKNENEENKIKINENGNREKDKEITAGSNQTQIGGIYLMKYPLIILGLCFIGAGIALFVMAPTLALKFLAIGLGILGAVGFGVGLFYNKIGDYYRKKPESCCISFLTYTIWEPKQKNKEININLEEEKNNIADKDEKDEKDKNVFK